MNKQKLLGLILAGIIATSAFTACGGNETTSNGENGGNREEVEISVEDPRFSLTVRDFPESFKAGKDGSLLLISGTIRRPRLISTVALESDDVTTKINDVLDMAYERNNTAVSELENTVIEARKAEGFDDETAGFPWTINSAYELVRNDGKVVTVKETVDCSLFGETDAVNYYYNFDVKTGDQISQLFFTEGNDQERDAIDDVVYNKLVEKYGNDVISYDNVASSFVESAVNSWYFTENGINLVYNHEEFAPLASEDLEIELTKDELPDFALEYFLN